MMHHPVLSQSLRRSVRLALAGVAALALLPADLPAQAADVWTPLGPSGGTVAAVAVDPADGDTVYAGSREAGVFKSTNGGRAWRPAGLDGGVTHLAVAPGPRTVYAETGFGIFRSRDGAATWTDLSGSLLVAAGTPFVLSLALSPTPGTIYAVSSSRVPDLESQVLKSTDGGDSWRTVWTPPSGVFPLGVFADPTDPQTLFVGTTDGAYWSADAGATWKPSALLRGNVFSIAVEPWPRHRLLAAVANGDPRLPRAIVEISSDRGRTWRPRDTLQSRPLSLLLADPTTPGGFYALGLLGDLSSTTDAGLHWTSLGFVPRGGTLSGVFDLALDPSRPGVAFVAVTGERFGRGFWKTASFGASWTPFFRGLLAGDFLTVTPDPAHPEILRAGAGSAGGGLGTSPLGLWTSFDRGATWLQTAFPGNSVPAIVLTSRSLFAAVSGQGLQKSDDDGLHWTRTTLQSTDIEALVATGEKPGTLYALALHPGGFALDVSLDNGATWTTRSIPGNGASTLAVATGAPATLYANASNRVIGPDNPDALRRSTDRGLTWTTLLTVSGGFLSAIGLDPADPRRIVVSFEHLDAEGKPMTSALWTADGGTTWNPGDLSPQPYRVFTLLPDRQVPHGFLAGTGEGAFQSADGGATWTRLGEGLPRARTHLSLDPASPATVYAATEGGGVYRLERTVP